MEDNEKWDDPRGASLYALLSKYGDVVNIYQSNNVENLDFKPLRLTPNGPAINPC